jgi:hypothetical protein
MESPVILINIAAAVQARPPRRRLSGDTVCRTVSTPVACHEQNASRWRFHYSEADKIETALSKRLPQGSVFFLIACGCHRRISFFP